MHGCVFQKFTGSHFCCEILLSQEMVINSILFTRTRLARGAGNGVTCEIIFFSAAAKGCFTAAGGAGYDEKGANHGRMRGDGMFELKDDYSMF